MKKIAILTQPLFINYGGILQAFALQKVITELGYEVVTIDRNYYTHPKLIRLLSEIKNKTLRLLTRDKTPVFSIQDLDYISKNTKDFVKKYIVLSERIDTDQKMIRHFELNNYDAVIVGSDQTWRPKYSPNIYNFYLDVINTGSTKRIAYACSFGVGNWEYDEIQSQKCKKLVQKFDAVSVREDSAVELCKKYFDVDAELLSDPTLLIDKQHYIDLFINQSVEKNKGLLFTYILDEDKNKRQIIDGISKAKKMVAYSHQPKESLKAPKGKNIQDYIVPPVEGWIKGFYDAGFVVTDSFHGVVFSIIFNKPFIAIANEERGISRFTSLLKQFDLEHRLIFSYEQLNNELISEIIDFDFVNGRTKDLKAKSLLFLNKQL
jgi:polysaccharide pyruvyl transferase WcaK-like protein